MLKPIIVIALFLIFILTGSKNSEFNYTDSRTVSEPKVILSKEDLKLGEHHLKHFDIFGKFTSGNNLEILKGIDVVQASAMDGGGYFVGKKANPTESPIGYKLNLFGKELVNLERTTSYCSGASYSAFIEGLNIIFKNKSPELDEDIYESMRMQEVDGGRREDGIKFWGKWNDDGYGNNFALVQYSGMGTIIEPADAEPGDFMNISWKSGVGHSVVFLGWFKNEDGAMNVVYWSSQKSTNGLGDDIVSIDRIKEVMIVRLSNPQNLFEFDVSKTVDRNVKGYVIDFEK